MDWLKWFFDAPGAAAAPAPGADDRQLQALSDAAEKALKAKNDATAARMALDNKLGIAQKQEADATEAHAQAAEDLFQSWQNRHGWRFTQVLNKLSADVRQKTNDLSAALKAANPKKAMIAMPPTNTIQPTGSPAIDGMIAAVAACDTVIASAITFVNSMPSLIATAVAAASANGATAAQLAPLTTLANDLQNQSAALTAALTANTPTPPVTPPTPPAPSAP